MPSALILDEDPATLEILWAYLRAEGHTVLEAAEGLGVREPLPRADVAVLDSMLPGMRFHVAGVPVGL